MMEKKSENAASAGADTNTWSSIIRDVIIVVLDAGSFVFWAVQVSLDTGAAADGTVTISSNRKTIQHPNDDRVTDVFIKEGDLVKKNQVFVRLDKMQPEMRFSMLSAQHISVRSIEDHLLAERDGLNAVVFNTTLTQQLSDNKRPAEVRNLQAKLFDTRHKTIQGELLMIQGTLDGLVGQTDNLSRMEDYRDHQSSLINRELEAIHTPSEKNYHPKTQLLMLKYEAAGISGSVLEDILNIAKLKLQQNKLKTEAY